MAFSWPRALSTAFLFLSASACSDPNATAPDGDATSEHAECRASDESRIPRAAIVLGAGADALTIPYSLLLTRYYERVYVNDTQSCDDRCLQRIHSSMCATRTLPPEPEDKTAVTHLRVCEEVPSYPDNLDGAFMGMPAEQISSHETFGSIRTSPFDVLVVGPSAKDSAVFPEAALVGLLSAAPEGTRAMVALSRSGSFGTVPGSQRAAEIIDRVTAKVGSVVATSVETLGSDLGLAAQDNVHGLYLRFWRVQVPDEAVELPLFREALWVLAFTCLAMTPIGSTQPGR